MALTGLFKAGSAMHFEHTHYSFPIGKNDCEWLHRKVILNIIGKIVISVSLRDFNKNPNLLWGRVQLFHKV